MINILNDFDSACIAFVQAEYHGGSDDWILEQAERIGNECPSTDYSLSHAHGKLLGWIARSGGSLPMPTFDAVVYGSGGRHRYFVYEDGEIVFDTYYTDSGSRSVRKKVLEAGFRTRQTRLGCDHPKVSHYPEGSFCRSCWADIPR